MSKKSLHASIVTKRVLILHSDYTVILIPEASIPYVTAEHKFFALLIQTQTQILEFFLSSALHKNKLRSLSNYFFHIPH